MSKVYKITPAIQPYVWGGTSYIAQWLGIQNESGSPMAEAWYGDHPLASATLSDDGKKLSVLLQGDSINILGKESTDTYGPRLPFLLKILDIKDMLSIQLHPTKEAAESGFEYENKIGIPSYAPNRNYKDNNHKPEILYALSDFWMLQGFESLDVIKNRFTTLLPEWKFSDQDTWSSLLSKILQVNREGLALLYYQSLSDHLSDSDTVDKNKIYHWLDKAIKAYPLKDDKIDIGLLVMLLLHVQYLKPGQVGYQAPGVLHAYLQGQNVELMANSDNVLRGGLTPKHIDAYELMKHVDFNQSGQHLIPAIYIMEDEAAYNAPVKDFMLKHFLVEPGTTKEIQFETASIVLIKSGRVFIEGIEYGDGESVLIPAYFAVDIRSISKSEYFIAFSSF